MPIYAYRCESCGHAKDVLQKMSDPVLSTCPACGAETFRKQLTAAGFQLKGSGWYVTDFRGGPTAVPPKAEAGGSDSKGSESKPGESKPAAAPAAGAAAAPAAPAAAPAVSSPAAAPGTPNASK